MKPIRPIHGANERHRAQFVHLLGVLVPFLALAAGVGALWSGVYKDNEFVVAQAVGQDWVTLLVAVPALIAALVLTRRGSFVGHLVALGVTGYVAYSYMIYAFASRHNSLFLVYVAVLGLSGYALVFGALGLERERIERMADAPIAWRSIAVFFGIAAAFFALTWLGEQVPALLRGETPKTVLQFGAPTNPVHVLDLAFVLPLCALAAVLMWRRRAVGAVLGVVLLIKIVTLALALLSMAVFMWMREQPGDPGLVIAFSVLLAIAATALVQVLRALRTT